MKFIKYRKHSSQLKMFWNKYRCFHISDGTETCYNLLYAAVNELQLMAMNRTLDVDIQNIIYVIDASNAQADSSVSCPTGMVSTQFYCSMSNDLKKSKEYVKFNLNIKVFVSNFCLCCLVPCAPGRYYRNDQCLKCDFGTYQDISGQLSCVECPDGTTTPGRESRSVTECSIKYDTETDCTLKIIQCIL